MARDYADILNGTFGDEQTPRAGRDLSVIFGSGVRLSDDSDSRTQRRLVVYPCDADAAQFNAAQGLMCALAWSIGALDSVVVIPLLTADPLLDSPSAAFTPEEVSLDGLGEDTVITSKLTYTDGVYRLTVNATTELENADDLKFEISGDSYATLLDNLLVSAAKFAVWLDGYETDAISLPPVQADGAKIKTWLEMAFTLHRAMLRDAASDLPFNFEAGEESPFYTEFLALRSLTADIASDATTWLLIQAMALNSIWFEEIDPEGFVEAVKTLGQWQIAAPALSRALIDMEDTRLALETLESAVNDMPQIALNWLVLARLYSAAQRPDLVLETIKRALEQHNTYAPLLMLYGEISLGYANQGLSHGHTIQPDTQTKPTMAGEASAAFKEVVKLTTGDQRAMAYVQLVTALTQGEDSGEIWPVMDALATSDSSGIYTELAIGAIAAQDEIEKAISGLERAVVHFPAVGQVWRNLAYVQYLSGDAAGATVSVTNALKYADTPKTRGDYELLALYAQDAKLERQLADIADLINAGTEISEKNLEFLEWIVGEAPHYAEGYLLLGRAYITEGEADTALEVLLDAEQNVGLEAEIVVAIVDLLRDSGEETVALDYVTKGLDAFPRDIRILARAAQVTHALGDDEGARAFLRQAHNIAPYHRELLRVTREIIDSEQEG